MGEKLKSKANSAKVPGSGFYCQKQQKPNLSLTMLNLGRKCQVLLVEDDLNLGMLLAEFLEENNCEVKLCRDGDSGWKAWNGRKYDFCILDLMLPVMDGFSLTKKIREKNKSVPIILLTARAMKEDKIKGFNLGVDDYITKPFDEEELLCRMVAILNRSSLSTTYFQDAIPIGNYAFEHYNQMLTCAGKFIRLTKTETEILRFLCKSKNKITKRDDLLEAVWGNKDYFTGRSLDVFITKLRKYLSADPKVRIESIPTVGYILIDE
jgi:DNA-binding response OmpR family regulator